MPPERVLEVFDISNRLREEVKIRGSGFVENEYVLPTYLL